jgi:polyphenol oxidase
MTATNDALPLLQPAWPAPPPVNAAVTTRSGGVSVGCHAALNLATHTGDAPDAVFENRRRLARATGVDAVQWLNQTHGTHVFQARGPVVTPPAADAVWTTERRLACAVLTADCLPVLMCDRAGTIVAAAHAGWRGLVDGILGATVAALPVPASNMMVWLGPGISGAHYEVGDDVRGAVLARYGATVVRAVFFPCAAGKWRFDLYQLSCLLLEQAGVSAVFGADYCTLSDARFYSYRRDGVTGRHASLIWLD